MKPSLDEVWAAIVRMHRRVTDKTRLPVSSLLEDMDEHIDNILPSLLFLAKEQRIKIDADKTVITVMNG
ncbi:MAG: hypothetical protein R2800_04465 [Flavipsychrobacter sp.]